MLTSCQVGGFFSSFVAILLSGIWPIVIKQTPESTQNN